MSDAIESQGFLLEIGNADSPTDYTEVKEITNFSGLDGQASEIDVTHLQSTAKEFRMGLQDWGSFNCDVNFLSDDPGQTAVRAAKASRDLTPFRVTLSDGKTILFNAFVTSAPISGGVDAKVDGSFNLRISGDVTGTAIA